eukprot:SAG11_NODE_12708_length_689_cov_1.049153_1_plen_83_part_01
MLTLRGEQRTERDEGEMEARLETIEQRLKGLQGQMKSIQRSLSRDNSLQSQVAAIHELLERHFEEDDDQSFMDAQEIKPIKL